jgi:hypothetical protein
MKTRQFLSGGDHYYIDRQTVTQEVFERELFIEQLKEQVNRIEEKLDKLLNPTDKGRE